METTDQLVRALADREAIRELSNRYCDCIWRKDIDGLVKLFTRDGAFRVEGLEEEAVARGHAKLKKVYEKAIGAIDPRLFVHATVVDLLSDTSAKGRCYVEVYSASFGMRRVGLGYYEDEYTKQSGQWKFLSRRYFLDEIDTTVSLRKTFMV
jgi:SnoaL-like domain